MHDKHENIYSVTH